VVPANDTYVQPGVLDAGVYLAFSLPSMSARPEVGLFAHHLLALGYVAWLSCRLVCSIAAIVLNGISLKLTTWAVGENNEGLTDVGMGLFKFCEDRCQTCEYIPLHPHTPPTPLSMCAILRQTSSLSRSIADPPPARPPATPSSRCGQHVLGGINRPCSCDSDPSCVSNGGAVHDLHSDQCNTAFLWVGEAA
jgi:hypothetical protein